MKPFTNGARGRPPLPKPVRTIIAGVTLVSVVGILAGTFIWAHSASPAKATTAQWHPGPSLAGLPEPVAAAPITDPAPATPAAPSKPVKIPVHMMQMWGVEQDVPAPVKVSLGGSDNQDKSSDKSDDLNASVYSDISMLLEEGTKFGCLPNEPIDTQIAARVSCLVDEPVLAADKHTILIDRGAIVTGNIAHGLGLGQDRAFILWEKVRSGRVHAVLNSAATDELGQFGVPGYLDEHLWQKIKATALLTGIEGVANIAQNETQKSGQTSFNFSSGQSLASQALQHDINIPTTLYRGQAWPLKVYVQHNVWFKRAYNNVLVADAR